MPSSILEPLYIGLALGTRSDDAQSAARSSGPGAAGHRALYLFPCPWSTTPDCAIVAQINSSWFLYQPNIPSAPHWLWKCSPFMLILQGTTKAYVIYFWRSSETLPVTLILLQFFVRTALGLSCSISQFPHDIPLLGLWVCVVDKLNDSIPFAH